MKQRTGVLIGSGVAVIVIALGVTLLMGNKSSYSKSDTTTATTKATTSKPQATNAVSIKDFAFGPTAITVKVGDTVTWTNSDSTQHTVTADTESSDAPKSGLVAQGATYSFTFTKAGTYKYHCEIHTDMQGTVTVTE